MTRTKKTHQNEINITHVKNCIKSHSGETTIRRMLNVAHFEEWMHWGSIGFQRCESIYNEIKGCLIL